MNIANPPISSTKMLAIPNTTFLSMRPNLANLHG
jgi:hypothetical protein